MLRLGGLWALIVAELLAVDRTPRSRGPPQPPKVSGWVPPGVGGVYLHQWLVLLIKGLPILPIVESGHAHNVFIHVDDWQWEHVPYCPATCVQRLFLCKKEQLSQQQGGCGGVWGGVPSSGQRTHLSHFHSYRVRPVSIQPVLLHLYQKQRLLVVSLETHR